MLHTAEFPYAGSQALYAGQLVDIRQRNADGSVTITGDRLHRRVDLGELAPPPPKTLFDRWREERLIVPKLGDVFTPVADVTADFYAWLHANEAPEKSFPTSHYAFERMMRDVGYRPETRAWQDLGDKYTRNRRLYAVSLRKPG